MKIGLPLLKKSPPDHIAGVVLQAVVVTFAGVLPQVAWTQAGAEVNTKPTISIVPRFSMSEKYTDNVSLLSTGKQSELITQISPGISIVSQAGRIKGTFDYSLNNLI